MTIADRLFAPFLAALAVSSGCGLIPVGGYLHDGATLHRFTVKPPRLVVASPDAGRAPFLRDLAGEVRVAERGDLREDEVFIEVSESRGGVGRALTFVYDVVFLLPALFVALPPLLEYDSAELTVVATDARGNRGEGRSQDSVIAAGTFLSPLLVIDMPNALRARPDVLLALKAALADLRAGGRDR